MSVRRIDYEELKLRTLRYLFEHRSEKEVGKRTATQITKNFKISKNSVSKAMYELKGMGMIDVFVVGNATIWFITEDGLNMLKERDKND